MFHNLNQWAHRWGPSIALFSAVIAVLTLIISYDFSAPRAPGAAQEKKSNIESAPSSPDVLPLTIKSAKTNKEDANIIGLRIDCDYLLKDPDFHFETDSAQEEIKDACFNPKTEHAYVRHFDRKIAGREDALIESAAQLISKLPSTQIISSDYKKACSDERESDFNAALSLSWASVALKAYLIAESLGLGRHVLDSLDRGLNPEDVLPSVQLLRDRKTTHFGSESSKILSTFHFDSFLKHYTDDTLIAWAKKLYGYMPEISKNQTHTLIILHLDRYHTVIKPQSGDLVKLYRLTRASQPMVEVNAGRIIANFPNDTLWFSCTDQIIDGFWLRRIMAGTDVRVAELAARFLQDR